MKRSLALSLIVGVLFGPAFSQQPLKDVFKGHFLIGGALNRDQFTGRDNRGAGIAAANFNTISPENILKWQSVQPREGKFDLKGADAYVAFGERHGMFIVGHTLVWHNQTPKWVFEGPDGKPASKELLTERLRKHIHTVVGRYKGKIRAWDVVNEALNEDGTFRESAWFKILGKEYISLAFKFAREADPAADLYYNDYSLENEAKRKGAIALVKWLQSENVSISGIGTQSHHGLEFPSVSDQEQTLIDFGKLGVKIAITELDVDLLPRPHDHSGGIGSVDYRSGLDPFKAGLPPEMEQRLTDRYAQIFRVILKHRNLIHRVTFWGVTDGDSWLNNWPVRGRTNYPLLWDRLGKPKTAYDEIVKVRNAAPKVP
jgi:endo-1,4-beta-xylanase